ncbi:arabinose 5-phosphate isomerase [Thermaurantimonas aggregans]|uniref:Arabinose 5-phosphate isomerase n=1 Tax=Thermaurantimonas aggregans TaxID=2173829 RepID=A0A401XP51_9FLAO|nr:KpsF/GutQ family sugar-phosphate isomerase [Thermaurantimonas aggregans]MCX8148101.1 KpsF/GutQ family sugar-phosphate isomerase [Thermaurantimonas aggregans]GCD78733.1 arabinose 5-phosphate isomerase [Thermaurantimonas aggregans]
MSSEEILHIARQTFDIEIQSLQRTASLLGPSFVQAVQAIAASRGKVIVTGMGKSGHIGHKISATLASTGTPSFFMHPAEAYHGDLGMVGPDDVVLAISNSGETDEILKLIPYLRHNGNTLIALTGNAGSTLARNAHIHLLIAITREACPLELAPTSSTTVTLALGDALAISLMKIRGFREENFARFHPGGSLGKRLLNRVKDYMRTDRLPVIPPDSPLASIISTMSEGRLGLAIVAIDQRPVGIITDGDLRRLLERRGKEAFDLTAHQIMTPHPKTISPEASLKDAEQLMVAHKINSLIVQDAGTGTIAGVIQIYDI